MLVKWAPGASDHRYWRKWRSACDGFDDNDDDDDDDDDDDHDHDHDHDDHDDLDDHDDDMHWQ